VLVKNGMTIGIGGGQTNRIDAARIAINAAGEKARGAVMASDGFLPFDDVVQAAVAADIGAIVQPGGSIRDELSIKAAAEAGLPMYFTGMRHFRH
ncbi:MAG TPA: bifunctional phosphoribosylaminoimidazolecarboxamide formyltransferase/inosine monophosphate cyclohydrolase, partial [Firmicutes bacterium]|nr:bifunctional phosphoribosylaminoimidazolecarboxamide formyltransferase/inosine monophosphate cyclohydrolase [Bacillota bacterium]HBL69098.1 bifunctional phosphoribosylaminoimidazolecarboxamide formyltransferase/inosine monophosphate cyclohydrolase [Bacillota bacterium]